MKRAATEKGETLQTTGIAGKGHLQECLGNGVGRVTKTRESKPKESSI